MIFKLLGIMLLIVLAGAIVPIIITKLFDKKIEVKELVKARHYPKDIIK